MRECWAEGCDRAARSRGLCGKHYQRLRAHGDVYARPPDTTERFFSKVIIRVGECWTWTAGRDGHGYGAFSVNGANVMAHRFSFEMHFGAIPEGKHLDHTCHNDSDCPGGKGCEHRRCVNPFHLEPIEPTENQFRSGRSPAALNAQKTHCNRGHEFTPENTRLYDGRRVCKECKRVAKFCKAVGGELSHTIPTRREMLGGVDIRNADPSH